MINNEVLKVLEKEYNKDITKVEKRIRNLSTKKCTLNNRMEMMKKETFEKEMGEVLKEWEILREYKAFLNGRKDINYLEMKREEILNLSYDDIEKGLRSLSSIKSRCKVERIEGIEKKYEEFREIKELKKEKNNGYVKKVDVMKLIKVVEDMGNSIKKKDVLELLNKLIVDVE